ncbi:uncharacterized protein LOC115084786 [Rhinatrema bivittatum]|uniref:uncharacterized protein LOC115084786 n=1 Tax=Rhinatrema bivittatum TaxID=194408 RepID=UPI001125EABE|nr:uncharacterized protein LOC115084786 [Rhinatrema bivittatum]
MAEVASKQNTSNQLEHLKHLKPWNQEMTQSKEGRTSKGEMKAVNQKDYAHTPSEKGVEMYEKNKQGHDHNIEREWHRIKQAREKVTERPTNLKYHVEQVRLHFKTYQLITEEYVEFLTRTNTTESLEERGRQQNLYQICQEMVMDTINSAEIDYPMSETGSQHSHASKGTSRSAKSHGSRHSSRSQLSSIILQKRAESQAAIARIQYDEEEAALKREGLRIEEQQKAAAATAMATAAVTAAAEESQKAEREITLDLLWQKREAAILEAQIKVFGVAQNHGDEGDPLSFMAQQDTAQQMLNYVMAHPLTHASVKTPPPPKQPLHQEGARLPSQIAALNKGIRPEPQIAMNTKLHGSDPSALNRTDAWQLTYALGTRPKTDTLMQPWIPMSRGHQEREKTGQPHSGGASAEHPEPKQETVDQLQPEPMHNRSDVHSQTQDIRPARPATFQDESSEREDLARYMTHREFITAGLYEFNDHPKSYRAWKSDFQDAVKNMRLTPQEEMNFMMKWLGRESVEHVRRLKIIHPEDPPTALKEVWERLERYYGDPVAIENAWFKEMENFPEIFRKDNQKLQELEDLLQELETVKAKLIYPGLNLLDTSRGMNSIINKLPSDIQDKWASHGAQYKEDNKEYPSFHVFANFI